MEKRDSRNERKEEIAEAIVDMIDDGSEGVTTLSNSPEAKYESIDEKTPGKE
jgi:DNA-binding ferritin-like protein